MNEVFIPGGPRNDDLFYYKQVEGFIHYGSAQGAFGYNESRAAIGTFGTWSFVIYIPWIIWGKIFGWNILSPIYCNIVILCVAYFVFYLCVKPTIKQAFLIFLMSTSFVFMPRYLLTCSPETTMIAMCILALAFCIKLYHKVVRLRYIIGAYGVIMVLTLIRPYYFLLFMFPTYYLYIENKKRKTIYVSIIVTIMSLCGYGFISNYLCAGFFSNLIDFSFIKMFKDGLINGFVAFLRIYGERLTECLSIGGHTLVNGSFGKNCFSLFLISLIWLCYRLVIDSGKEPSNKINWILLTSSYILFISAVLILYQYHYCNRHLAPWIVITYLILILFENNSRVVVAMMSIVLWTGVFNVTDDGELAVPKRTEELVETLESGKEQLADSMKFSSDSKEWDKSVIWHLYGTDWHMLYALPEGYGMSICETWYLIYNFDELKSKYLCTAVGDAIDEMCIEKGKKLIASYGDVNIYELR